MKFLSTIFTGMLLLLTTTLSHGAIVYTDCGDGVTPELGGGLFTRSANYSFSLPQDTGNVYQMSYTIMDTTRFSPSGGQVTKLARIKNIAAAGTLDSDNQTWLAYKLDAGVSVGEATSFQTEEGNVSLVAMLYAESTQPSNDYNGYWEDMASEETGFIGLSFSYGDDLFYGWAELGIDTDTGMFTVYGYAYDDTPGTAVLTGDTGSSVPVPSAGWLMVTGILALAGLKRTRPKA